MPASRPERIVFIVGLVAIAILVALLVPAVHSYRSAAAAASNSTTVSKTPPAKPRATPPAAPSRPVRPARPTEVTTAVVATTSSVVAPVAPKAKPKQKPKPKPPVAQNVKLKLTAARGDCWMEVHNGSSKGKTLYSGTLSKGKSYVAPVHKLWIRFGAPQNVDLLLAGRKVTVPVSSFNLIVTPKGVHPTA